jgi:predicted RNA-binding Zn-ribbon protein involved in translation (DUF1610 family)
MTPSTEQQLTGKATLYCPDCGHESHINGDWVIDVLADSTTYECPECGTEIDSRCNRKELIAGCSQSLCLATDD